MTETKTAERTVYVPAPPPPRTSSGWSAQARAPRAAAARAPRRPILFGSQTRGAAGAGSDVDVAVEGAVGGMSLAAELGEVSGREVDVLELREAGYPLRAVGKGFTPFGRRRQRGASGAALEGLLDQEAGAVDRLS